MSKARQSYKEQPHKKSLLREVMEPARVEQVGCRNMSTHELLALITDPETATKVLAAFPICDLTRVDVWRLEKFVTRRIARKVVAAIEFGKRVHTTPRPGRRQIMSPLDAANILIPEMQGLDHEELRVMLLDAHNQVMGIRTVLVGNLNQLLIRGSDVFRAAIVENASAIIIAHNHASGVPDPSPEDIQATENFAALGEELDIPILDHIIIGAGCYYSMQNHGVGVYDNNIRVRKEKK